MCIFRFYYRRVKICLKAGAASALRTKLAAQTGLKRVLMFLFNWRCIPRCVAGFLLLKKGLSDA